MASHTFWHPDSSYLFLLLWKTCIQVYKYICTFLLERGSIRISRKSFLENKWKRIKTYMVRAWASTWIQIWGTKALKMTIFSLADFLFCPEAFRYFQVFEWDRIFSASAEMQTLRVLSMKAVFHCFWLLWKNTQAYSWDSLKHRSLPQGAVISIKTMESVSIGNKIIIVIYFGY